MAGMYPDNQEISVFGKTVKFPGVDKDGKFTNGDFSNPDTPPSFLDATTVNLIIDNLNALIAHLGNTANNTDAEQLSALFTAAAAANKAVKRDAAGRAKVAAPAAADDIARKAEVDAEAKQRSDDDIGIKTSLSNHTQSKLNPHGVTKAQVGLGNADNTADKDKTVKEAGTCTGNAATATKWQTARNLNGLSVQGDADRTNYATCSTAAATQAKVCNCAGFALVTGAEITVKFTVTNTVASPTLNVNGTGAKPLFYRGSAIAAGYLAAKRTYTFRYNGTQYELVGDLDTNTTYSAFVKSGGGAKAGLVPSPPKTAGASKYLREDGTWSVPPDTNTTYSPATANANGLMSSTDKSRLDANYVTASNFGTTSGYIKYSNGLLIQWGRCKAGTIPFPTAFSNTNYSVCFQWNGSDTSDHLWASRTWSVYSRTEVNFTVWNWGGTNDWIAIGF